MPVDLDALYREHPDGFVAARNELARELRSSGDRDAAEALKQLRRPSAAAWLLNRVALTSPRLLAEFAEARRRLEAAQRHALDGDDGAAEEWRAAAARERDALAEVIGAAAAGAEDAGHAAGARALELAGETLRAAAGDPELLDLVVRGRLEREQSGATLGTLELGPPDPAEAKRSRRRDAKRREGGRERAGAQARREVRRLEAQLDSAHKREERMTRQAEQAADALRARKAELAESKRETAALQRRLKAANKRAQRT